MFLSFGERGLVTCSADHLLVLWKNGERQSHLRSVALFQKLEENGGIWLDVRVECEATTSSLGFWWLLAFLFITYCLTFCKKQCLYLRVKYSMSNTKCLELPLLPAFRLQHQSTIRVGKKKEPPLASNISSLTAFLRYWVLRFCSKNWQRAFRRGSTSFIGRVQQFLLMCKDWMWWSPQSRENFSTLWSTEWQDWASCHRPNAGTID